MMLTLDLTRLDTDQQHKLCEVLETVVEPTCSCQIAVISLKRLMTESHNKFLRNNPNAVLQAFSGGNW